IDEESEYHFNEEDINYEIEPEPSKPPPEKEPKPGLWASVLQKKRILIGLAVFLGLVFVVYKMISPTVMGPPGTEITRVPTPPPAPMPMGKVPIVPVTPPIKPPITPPPGTPIPPPGALPLAGIPPPGTAIPPPTPPPV